MRFSLAIALLFGCGSSQRTWQPQLSGDACGLHGDQASCSADSANQCQWTGNPCASTWDQLPTCPPACPGDFTMCGSSCPNQGEMCIFSMVGDGATCQNGLWECAVHPPLGPGCNLTCRLANQPAPAAGTCAAPSSSGGVACGCVSPGTDGAGNHVCVATSNDDLSSVECAEFSSGCMSSVCSCIIGRTDCQPSPTIGGLCICPP
jgi:hypothetical protein